VRIKAKYKSLKGILTLWFSSNFKSIVFLTTLGWVSKVEPSIKKEIKPSIDLKSLTFVTAIENALDHANRRTNFPSPIELRFMEGMSGQRFRAFLNHLSKGLGEFNYLEIGVWKGSTAKCILYESSADALLVDNWSQFGGPRNTALKSLSQYIDKGRVELLDIDFNQLPNFKNLLSPKVYYYDGPHDYASHYLGIELIKYFNSECIIVIIDDWNWDNVKNGTLNAIKDLDFEILASWQIKPSPRDKGGKLGSWHNGTFIALIRTEITHNIA
jgi:hypothetical protein